MTSLMVVLSLVELALMENQLDTKGGAAAPEGLRGTHVCSQEQGVANECWKCEKQLEETASQRLWQLGMEAFIQVASCSRWE